MWLRNLWFDRSELTHQDIFYLCFHVMIKCYHTFTCLEKGPPQKPTLNGICCSVLFFKMQQHNESFLSFSTADSVPLGFFRPRFPARLWQEAVKWEFSMNLWTEPLFVALVLSVEEAKKQQCGRVYATVCRQTFKGHLYRF